MKKTILIISATLLLGLTHWAFAQGTAFTYQGRLNDGASPAGGIYDIRFAIYNAASGGAQQGNTVTNIATGVTNGLFTVTLDFGNQFPGAARWLEIGVRTNGGGAFATLTPRQPTTSSPYAVRASAASSVDAVGIIGTLSGSQLPAALSGTFTGNGGGLTNLNGSNIVAGTIADARLSANVALRAGGNTFTGNQIVTNGNVGVGTTSPQQLLQVGDNAVIGSQGIIRLGSRAANGAARLWDFGCPMDPDSADGKFFSFMIQDTAVTDPAFVIRWDSQYVGIGTTNPGAKLDVQGSIAVGNGDTLQARNANGDLESVLWPRYYDNAMYLNYGASGFNIRDNNSVSRMFFDSFGNVGIGTMNPLAKLHVNGAARATQFVGGSFVGDGSGLTNLPITLLELVTGPTVSAQPNEIYAHTNSSTSTITLPLNANVGDLIEIDSLGSAGWQVQPNSGQSIKGFSTAPGFTWISYPPSNRWSAVAASADGMKLVAVPYIFPGGGHIFTSTDGGTNWIARSNSPIVRWVSVASSANGTKLVAGTENSTLYTSSDSGVTWTARAFPASSWQGLASSADGVRLAATHLGGQIHISTDSGVTWVPRGPTTNWGSIACSADGSKLVASILGTPVYISTDGGTNWITQTNYPTLLCVASSADGATLAGGSYYGGRIYVSTNSGADWNLTGPNTFFNEISSSADGSRLLAASTGGQLYTSIDRGVNWIAGGPATNWGGVACSSDGTRLVAAQQAGPIHTSSGSVFTTAPGSSVTLQYAGNGVWQADNLQSSSSLPNTIVTRDSSGNFSAGAVTATAFIGNGGSLSNLSASQLTTGTVADARLSSNVSLLGQTIESAELTDGTIVNADINASAAIADTKLATISAAGKVADSALSANVTKLGSSIESSEITDGTIASADIADNTIVNADINAAAGIADTKLATITTAGKVADSALSANVAMRSGGNMFSGTQSNAGHLYLTGGGTLYTDNGPYFYAKNSAQNYEGYLVPRWFDNGMYMNFGDGGFFLRDNYNNYYLTALTNGTIVLNGNVGIGISPTNKLHVAGGVSATTFVTTSDRNAKENFVPVSPQEVLNKVAALPSTTWNFKDLKDGRHMGPMAQDFHAAFGLGGGDTTITSIDPDGVALAAIQGLNQKVEIKDQKSEIRIQKLEAELKRRDAENAELKKELLEIKRLLVTLSAKGNHP